jgi:hypothetical protein
LFLSSLSVFSTRARKKASRENRLELAKRKPDESTKGKKREKTVLSVRGRERERSCTSMWEKGEGEGEAKNRKNEGRGGKKERERRESREGGYFPCILISAWTCCWDCPLDDDDVECERDDEGEADLAAAASRAFRSAAR